MARRGGISKRVIAVDPKYGDESVAKFINHIMMGGKKSVSQRIVYGALDLMAERVSSDDSLATFRTAIENVEPLVQVRSRRVGGATYQVPVEVRVGRRRGLAMRWIVEQARRRSEKSMLLRLAGELMDAAEGRGGAVKKRNDVHRMAEANKAFSHYRF